MYLSDFGITRLIDSGTTTLVGAGTPAYMAPEIIAGRDPSKQTDIYSLGIILYEIYTGGERPFTGDNAKVSGSTSTKIIWEHINAVPPSPRLYNPKLSADIESVILKCLVKEPQKRFNNIQELQSAIEHIYQQDKKSFLDNYDKVDARFRKQVKIKKKEISAKPESKKYLGKQKKSTSQKKSLARISVIIILLALSILIIIKFTLQKKPIAMAITATIIPGTQITTIEISDAGRARYAYDMGMEIADQDTFMSGTNPMLIGFGWYAKTSQILNQNLSVMKWEFMVDDISVPTQSISEESLSFLGEYPGLFKMFLVKQWPIGIHNVKVGFVIDSSINDGFVSFEAGNYIDNFTIRVLPKSDNPDYLSWNHVYTENFYDDLSDEWLDINIENQDKVTHEIKNDKLVVSLKTTNENLFDYLPVNFNVIGDFLLKVSVKLLSGDPSQACYGIGIFDSYNFTICNDQYYSISYQDRDDHQLIKDWTDASIINEIKQNDLWILKTGNTYKFFINHNNIFETDVKDEYLQSFYIFGNSYDGSSATFEFDNIELLVP